MKLVSERGINRTLKTIDRRGKKIEFPYKFDDNLIVTQPWNMKNFMVLDIIADIYIRKYCNKLNLDIPKSPYDSNVLEFSKNMTKDSLKNIKIDDDINTTFIIKDKEIFMDYRFLLEYNSNQLYSLFKNTSDCLFKINYHVRTYNEESKKYELSIYNNFDNGFESLFNIEIIDQVTVGRQTQGLTYKISFNSCLSKLFLHNILTVNFDWIDLDMYNLKNISQLIYRKYILTNQRRKKFIITYDDFMNVLGLNVNNITIVKKNIEFGLKILQENNIIKTWRLGIRSRRDLTYYEIEI